MKISIKTPIGAERPKTHRRQLCWGLNVELFQCQDCPRGCVSMCVNVCACECVCVCVCESQTKRQVDIGGISLETLWQFGRLVPYVNTEITQSSLGMPASADETAHAAATSVNIHTTHTHTHTLYIIQAAPFSVRVNNPARHNDATRPQHLRSESIKRMWQEVKRRHQTRTSRGENRKNDHEHTKIQAVALLQHGLFSFSTHVEHKYSTLIH